MMQSSHFFSSNHLSGQLVAVDLSCTCLKLSTAATNYCLIFWLVFSKKQAYWVLLYRQDYAIMKYLS